MKKEHTQKLRRRISKMKLDQQNVFFCVELFRTKHMSQK